MNRFLLAGLALAGLAVVAAPAPAADPAKYLPNDTSMVMSFNVQQLLGSDLVKKHALEQIKSAMMVDPQAQQVFKDLGLDPLKDFDRVTIAVGGDGPEKPFIIVQGKFDTKKIEAKAADFAKTQADKLKISKEADGTVYEVSGGPTPMYAAVVDDTTLAASPAKAAILDAQARAQGKKKASLPKEIQNQVASADEKASAWMAVDPLSLIEKIPQAAGQPGAKGQMQKIAVITGTFNVASDVKIELSVVTKTDDDAKVMSKQIEDGLMQAKAALPLLLGQQEELKPVIELVSSLKSSASGKTITIKGGLTADYLEKALKKG